MVTILRKIPNQSSVALLKEKFNSMARVSQMADSTNHYVNNKYHVI
jgi:hypothetical protein